MKQISILLGMILYITACGQADYNYEVENTILDCFNQYHKEHNIDVEHSINKVEDVLIEHKVLKDNTGESYIRIIEQIRDQNELEIDDSSLILDLNAIGYIPSGIFCADSAIVSMLDSSVIVNSKLKYVIRIFDSIQAQGDISPTHIATEILEVFNSKDFENNYYRTLGLVMLSNLIKMNDYDSGIPRKLRTLPTKKPTAIEKQNKLCVLINNEDKVCVDGKPVEISSIKGLAKRFILETSDKKDIELPLLGKQQVSKGVISMQNSNGTSYKIYVAVQKELMQAYREIRDAYSKEFFNTTFDHLEKVKQKEIKALVPMKISEADPEI